MAVAAGRGTPPGGGAARPVRPSHHGVHRAGTGTDRPVPVAGRHRRYEDDGSDRGPRVGENGTAGAAGRAQRPAATPRRPPHRPAGRDRAPARHDWRGRLRREPDRGPGAGWAGGCGRVGGSGPGPGGVRPEPSAAVGWTAGPRATSDRCDRRPGRGRRPGRSGWAAAAPVDRTRPWHASAAVGHPQARLSIPGPGLARLLPACRPGYCPLR